jgi:hypothetical protein
MFLSIATTHQPATDLGFLLHKHPDRSYAASSFLLVALNAAYSTAMTQMVVFTR